MSARVMWQPTPERMRAARVTAFMHLANARHGLQLGDHASLYAWSIERPADFWRLVWDYGEVRGSPGQARR